MRFVIHNYATRSVGRFRATGRAHDHGDDCHCGGSCDKCRQHDGLEQQIKQTEAKIDDLNYKIDRVKSSSKKWFDLDKERKELYSKLFKLQHAFRSQRDSYAKANLGIDVTYAKGPMGRKITETRHYSVPNVTVNPSGHSPDPGFVAASLRRLPEHASMVRAGWTAEKAEGYYKQEQRDVGKRV